MTGTCLSKGEAAVHWNARDEAWLITATTMACGSPDIPSCFRRPCSCLAPRHRLTEVLQALLASLASLVDARRVQPEEDLLSVLVQGEQQGAFTPQEVVANTLLLLAAGHETTINLIGNGLLAFLRHPEQWAVFTHAPRQHAFLATEERLCYDAPVKSFTRIALDEVTYQPTWIVKEHIVPQAILFDLDGTLTDRTQSIVHYAERFQGDFAGYLASTTVSTIAAALLTADVRGYRPREDVVRDFSQRLPWRTVPDISRLRRHWETCFPRSVVARVGLAETLSTLHAR